LMAGLKLHSLLCRRLFRTQLHQEQQLLQQPGHPGLLDNLLSQHSLSALNSKQQDLQVGTMCQLHQCKQWLPECLRLLRTTCAMLVHRIAEIVAVH
jgi:hypothetical protein